MSAARRVRNVSFAGAIARPGETPPLDLPQVAIAGRSNVGKSSLINRVVGRKRLARTSKQPGRTQEINFFAVDDAFLLADLPGYGFARAPSDVREHWGELIERYLSGTPRLLGIVLLVDARRGLGPDDEQMLAYLEALGTPALVALTKVDKLNRSGRRKAGEKIRTALGVDADQFLETSAKTGEGVGALRDSLYALVEGGVTDGGAG